MRLPAPTDIVMRVDAVTICGTDLHILKGDVPEVRDPGVGDGLPGSRSRAVIDEGLHRTPPFPLLAWIVGGAAGRRIGDDTDLRCGLSEATTEK